MGSSTLDSLLLEVYLRVLLIDANRISPFYLDLDTCKRYNKVMLVSKKKKTLFLSRSMYCLVNASHYKFEPAHDDVVIQELMRQSTDDLTGEASVHLLLFKPDLLCFITYNDPIKVRTRNEKQGHVCSELIRIQVALISRTFQMTKLSLKNLNEKKMPISPCYANDASRTFRPSRYSCRVYPWYSNF